MMVGGPRLADDRRAHMIVPGFRGAKSGLRPAPPKPHLPLPGELRSPTPDQVRGRLSPQAGEERIVAVVVTLFLTSVSLSVTNCESCSPKGRQPATPAGGARAVPAGGGSSPPLPGGFGKTPGRHDDRSATLSLDWDRQRRITPVLRRVPGSAFWS